MCRNPRTVVTADGTRSVPATFAQTRLTYRSPRGTLCSQFMAPLRQRRLATESRDRVDALIPGTIVTEITDAGAFWIAEDYHQDFHRTHPVRYVEWLGAPEATGAAGGSPAPSAAELDTPRPR